MIVTSLEIRTKMKLVSEQLNSLKTTTGISDPHAGLGLAGRCLYSVSGASSTRGPVSSGSNDCFCVRDCAKSWVVVLPQYRDSSG